MVNDQTWRLFIAFALPEPWLDGIALWQREQLSKSEGSRLIRRANLHVTLVFLGDVARQRHCVIEETMAEALANNISATLTVDSVKTTQSVVMLQLQEHGDGISRLQRNLSTALADAGISRLERRAWLPHVTVARHRAAHPPRVVAAKPGLEAWCPSEVALYHSPIHVRGAHYSIVQSLPIGGSSG